MFVPDRLAIFLFFFNPYLPSKSGENINFSHHNIANLFTFKLGRPFLKVDLKYLFVYLFSLVLPIKFNKALKKLRKLQSVFINQHLPLLFPGNLLAFLYTHIQLLFTKNSFA